MVCESQCSRTMRSSVFGLTFAICLALSGSLADAGYDRPAKSRTQKGTDMTKHATGTFDVKVIPERTG